MFLPDVHYKGSAAHAEEFQLRGESRVVALLPSTSVGCGAVREDSGGYLFWTCLTCPHRDLHM